MTNREQILKEIEEISPVVANLQNENVYSVPYLYFENLPQMIMQKVTNKESKVYDSSPEMPYTIPPLYFENLASDILQKAKASQFHDELEEIAPLLNTISKAPVYKVPGNYFENNLLTITDKSVVKPARVVKLSPVRKMVTYVAAAAITGLMVIGSFLYLNKEDNQMVINTPAASNVSVADALSALSETEIIEYLKNYTPAIDVTNATYNTPHMEGVIDQYLDEMSDEEIRQYLKETAEPGEKKLKPINS